MFRNTLAQAGTFLSSQIYSFLLAPIMIDRLGLTLFGVWTVVGAIATYAGVLDGGITRALSRFIAQYDTRGDTRSIQQCIGLGLLAFTVIGALLLPVAWLAGPPLASALGHLTGAQMRQVLVAQAVMFLVQGYSAVLQGLPQGLRRMVPSNIAVTSGNTVNFVASVTALLLARSLVRYAWFNAGAETISVLLVLISTRFVWHERLAAIPSRGIVKQVLGYSVKSQVSWVADLINLQTDKLVIGLLVSPTAAGIYQLGSSVAGAVRSTGVISLSAMIPTGTAEIAREGRAAVRRLALHYMPLVLGVSLPIFVASALGAPFLFTLWVGRTPRNVVPVLIALNLAYMINIATGVPSTLTLADGRPGFVARNSMLMAGLNVVLTVALAPVFGLAGVVAGTVVSVSSLSIVFIVSFARSYGIGFAELRGAMEQAGLLSITLAVPFIPVVAATAHLGGSRLSAGALLVGVTLGYFALYWPLASWLGLLPARLARRSPLSRAAAIERGPRPPTGFPDSEPADSIAAPHGL